MIPEISIFNGTIVVIEEGFASPLTKANKAHMFNSSATGNYCKEWYEKTTKALSNFGLSKECYDKLMWLSTHYSMEKTYYIQWALDTLKRQKTTILSSKEIDAIIDILFN